MKIVNIKDVQADLLTLVDEAAKGHPFMIEMGGNLLVKVLPADDKIPLIPQRLGFMSGDFSVPDDFDTFAQKDIESMFYEEK